MLGLEGLPALWLALLGVVWALYLGLGGADLGVSMLTRRFEDRKAVLRSNGATWATNDVWLVIAVAATLGAFPGWYAAWLSGLYGTDMKKAVKRTHATRWSSDPWVLGSTAIALVAGQPSRRTLMEPVRERIFFAGEAVHDGQDVRVQVAFLPSLLEAVDRRRFAERIPQDGPLALDPFGQEGVAVDQVRQRPRHRRVGGSKEGHAHLATRIVGQPTKIVACHYRWGKRSDRHSLHIFQSDKHL